MRITAVDSAWAHGRANEFIDYDPARGPLSSDSASRNGTDPRSARVIERIVVLGYILAVAMPPIGFGLGVGLGVRTKSRHWLWIVLLSFAAAVVWAVIIGTGGLSSTNQGY